jgi:hypothetical protein
MEKQIKIIQYAWRYIISSGRTHWVKDFNKLWWRWELYVNADTKSFEQSIDNNQIGHDSDMNALMGEVE